jgi:hypothetical protein
MILCSKCSGYFCHHILVEVIQYTALVLVMYMCLVYQDVVGAEQEHPSVRII